MNVFQGEDVIIKKGTRRDVQNKKIVLLLALMILGIGLTVIFSQAADPANTGKNAPIDFSTDSHVCPVCGGSAVTWKPLPQITSNTTLAAGKRVWATLQFGFR